MKFSVLISIYEKENADFFDSALQSVLVNQTVIPDEVVIVKDGKLPSELETVIQKYENEFKNIIKVVGYDENRGLGKALRFGMTYCSHELIARMDSDDVSANDRFEKQLRFMKGNPDVSVVGSYISEFYKEPSDCKFVRKTPQNNSEIKVMLKKRNPMNHMTVMFRKSDIEQVDGYKDLPYLEDYYLWVRLLGNGFKLQNMKEVLVFARTGMNMYKKRGNRKYIAGWKKLQNEMLNMKLINRFDYIINMINIIGFIYTPSIVKESVYKMFLREKA